MCGVTWLGRRVSQSVKLDIVVKVCLSARAIDLGQMSEKTGKVKVSSCSKLPFFLGETRNGQHRVQVWVVDTYGHAIVQELENVADEINHMVAAAVSSSESWLIVARILARTTCLTSTTQLLESEVSSSGLPHTARQGQQR